MKPMSIRDVVGPIMVGPSSSHTAGALRIASMVRNLLDGEPVEVTFTLFGSFAHTYHGHGTDRALVAGMLGLHTDDLRVRNSFDLAKEQGLEFSFEPDTVTKTAHPNTVEARVVDCCGNEVVARGVSIGGGAAELTRIDGIDVHHGRIQQYDRSSAGPAGNVGSYSQHLGRCRHQYWHFAAPPHTPGRGSVYRYGRGRSCSRRSN